MIIKCHFFQAFMIKEYVNLSRYLGIFQKTISFLQTEEIQAVIEKQPHAAVATLENTKNCIS